MKVVIPKGATSRILTVFIQANNVTTGAGLGSLTNASSIVGGFVREGSTGVALAVDEDVTTEGTYQAPSAQGKVRIGTPANMRSGTYELHFHNNLWATGAETVTITLGGAANMADLTIEVQLSDPVRGLGAPTALPNAAADAAGGLPISAAGSLDLDTLLGRLDAAISTRSTYAGADTSGTTTLLSRLSAQRATNLDNLDAAISTRSTYAGADTSGTTTLLSRLSAQRATNLDNLDATITSRSSHAADDVWAVTTRTLSAFAFSVTVGTNNDKTGYALTSGERNSVADAYLDRADGIETGVTPRAAIQRIGAAAAGKVSGAGTGTETFLGLDGLTTRITVTVDSSGNRTEVVYA